jgi:hypothetical protein
MPMSEEECRRYIIITGLPCPDNDGPPPGPAPQPSEDLRLSALSIEIAAAILPAVQRGLAHLSVGRCAAISRDLGFEAAEHLLQHFAFKRKLPRPVADLGAEFPE